MLGVSRKKEKQKEEDLFFCLPQEKIIHPYMQGEERDKYPYSLYFGCGQSGRQQRLNKDVYSEESP